MVEVVVTVAVRVEAVVVNTTCVVAMVLVAVTDWTEAVVVTTAVRVKVLVMVVG